MRDYEIRLIGHDSEDGEILFEDLDRIGTAIKETVYRLTREAAERSGAGRAPAEVERLSSVRLGLAPGSTCLKFRIGERHALSVDPLAEDVDAAFWSIVEGLRDNQKPERLGDSVTKAVSGLVVALRKAAPKFEVTVPGHGQAAIVSDTLELSVWSSSTADVDADAVVHGRLEMVDLRSARFRLVDAVGNAVDLVAVRNPIEASALIGLQITATGPLHRGSGAKHDRMEGPSVAAMRSVHELLDIPAQPTFDELIARARHSPEPSGIDLTDDELDEFLAVIRG